MTPNTWGIIYCPKKGLKNSKKRWTKIEKRLEELDVDYDFVQSENQKSVERLMKMLINNGYKTIVIVGGDRALNDAVNCLMLAEKDVRDEIALGVIPNGSINDFAKFWEIEEGDIENNINTIIKKRIRKVDLGCIHYTNEEQTSCHRYFLNCVNIGLTAAIMKLRRSTKQMFGSETLSFISSTILLLFQRLDYKMKIKINFEEIDRKLMTVCIGNAKGYGQTPNGVPYNGLLDVSAITAPRMMQLFEGLYMMLNHKFLNHKNVRPYRTREVNVIEAKHAPLSIDGRQMRTPVGAFKVDVEQEVINFIIP